MRELPLGSSDTEDVEVVVAKAGDLIFHMDPGDELSLQPSRHDRSE